MSAILMLAALAAVQPKGFNYDESKVPKFELPDPLTMADGTRVTKASQWPARRAEIFRLFQKHVYGTAPPAPENIQYDVVSEGKALGGKALRKRVQIRFSPTGPAAELLLYIPAEAKAPVPGFLTLNFRGNHTITDDPEVPINPHKAKETRGSRKPRWAVDMILDRGYALGTICYFDIDPDRHDGWKNGIHPLFPELQGRPDNFASICAWAWGLSRALDYLQTDPHVDGKRVAVMGHSRLGKTSLWAGASDPRFALVISNDSGCGGAALSRRAFGETVKRINTSFPHWFCDRFKTYNDKETDCPVDQHMLIALIAPRPVYIASAEGDRWADPRGEFLSGLNADPVYRLLGTEGLPTKEWPEVNTPVHGRIGYHIRTGKHDVTDFDWKNYLDFADKHLSR